MMGKRTRIGMQRMVVAAIGLAHAAHAQVLIDDDFSTGRAGWYRSSASSVAVSGGWLQQTKTTAAGFPQLVRHFDSTTLKIGDRLELEFTMQLPSASVGMGWSHGLYNSGGQKIVADNWSADNDTKFSAWVGYDVSHALNSALRDQYIYQRVGGVNNLYGSGGRSELVKVQRNNGISGNTPFTVKMKIEYKAANEMVITSTVNGQTITVTHTAPVTTFDSFSSFPYVAKDGSFSLDIVKLERIPPKGTVVAIR